MPFRHQNQETTAQLLPIAEINTTPLIDVMLVLLIMFVITIPIANHTLDIDLPAAPGSPNHPILPSNRIALDQGNNLTWNDAPITLPQLDAALNTVHRTNPEPEVRFEPAGAAPYGTAAEVVRRIKRSGIASFGFVGNERYEAFDKAMPQP